MPKKALEVLESIQPESLKDQDHSIYLEMSFSLYFRVGRADLVAKQLRDETFRKRHHPFMLANVEVLAGPAVGDYEMTDRGLGTGTLLPGHRQHRRRQPLAMDAHP